MISDLIAATFQDATPRVIATLYGSIHDLELVEDALQDALVVALERWPAEGIPLNPGGWIMTDARHKATDRLRRNAVLERKTASLKALMELEQQDDTMDLSEIPDERLKLIFTCCHPALAQ